MVCCGHSQIRFARTGLFRPTPALLFILNFTRQARPLTSQFMEYHRTSNFLNRKPNHTGHQNSGLSWAMALLIIIVLLIMKNRACNQNLSFPSVELTRPKKQMFWIVIQSIIKNTRVRKILSFFDPPPLTLLRTDSALCPQFLGLFNPSPSRT